MKNRIIRLLCLALSMIVFLSVINLPALKVNAVEGIETEEYEFDLPDEDFVTPANAALDTFIKNWYKTALGRNPGSKELASWKKELNDGVTCGARAAYGFLFSAEYQNKKKSNSAFVEDCYKLLLGRDSDTSGKKKWVNQLKNGASRELVFAGFVNSVEFYNKCKKLNITAGYWETGYNPNQMNNVNMFVARLYKTCLGRIGDKDGQQDWVQKLIKGKITGSKCAHDFFFSKEFKDKKYTKGTYVKKLYTAMMGRKYDQEGYDDWVYKLKNGMTRDEVFAGFANSDEFGKICKSYGIKKGTYKATDIGTFDPNKKKQLYDWHSILSYPEPVPREDNPEGRMAHNIYSDPVLYNTSGKYSGFLIDFCSDSTPIGTYWALCNWGMDVSDLRSRYTVTDDGGAYAGLQSRGDGKKAIMSFWEIHYNNEYGRDTVIRAKRVYPKGDTSSFGGEGEGTNYITDYNWKTGEWYRMYLCCYDDAASGHTYVEQWVQEIKTGVWTKISCFDTGLSHSCFKGNMSQFMENYLSGESNEVRTFAYKNIYVREYATGEWKPVTQSKLSVDTWWDNKKGNFAYTADKNTLYGITCGYGRDAAKLNDVIEGYYNITPTANPVTP